jgi:hypothetical protein
MTDSEVYYPTRSNPMTKSDWISVKDDYPREFGHYLVFIPSEYGVDVEYYESRDWKGVGWSAAGITHWMPLPEPPGDAK